MELAAIFLSSLSHFPAQLKRESGSAGSDIRSAAPSFQPTPPARPTLRKVRERDRCGTHTVLTEESFTYFSLFPTLSFHMFE